MTNTAHCTPKDQFVAACVCCGDTFSDAEEVSNRCGECRRLCDDCREPFTEDNPVTDGRLCAAEGQRICEQCRRMYRGIQRAEQQDHDERQTR